MSDASTHLMQVCEVTWPPARSIDAGPFTLRDGAGGGKRVSAATLKGGDMPSDTDLREAEAAMRAMGQTPLFQIRPGEEAFDARLAIAGYRVIDPVNLYVIEAEALTDKPLPRVTTFCIWEPLAIMRDLWAGAGIGPERIAVMARAEGPKTSILGRIEDTPAGTAFVGLHGDTAMLHALEVVPEKRRKGLADWMMRASAVWTVAQGGTRLSVLCVADNAAANGLYRSMGFRAAGQYHYRIKTS